MEKLETSFKKLGWKVRDRSFGFGVSPETDWKIILVSTAILTVLVIVLSVFMFIKIDKGEIFVVEKSAEYGEKTLDISLLEKTVLYYQNKALEFKKITGISPAGIEPASSP